MSGISEYLIKLQEITQQNLDILTALNDSFFTKQNHLSVNVAGQQFMMPSFISLENKVNVLAANLENIINAPESGEAFFNMDGNSRSIEVRPYNQAPNSIKLNTVTKFSVDKTDIFKDFLTPIPYVKFATTELPNDITKVIIKKVVPLNPDLVAFFHSNLNYIQEKDWNESGQIDNNGIADSEADALAGEEKIEKYWVHKVSTPYSYKDLSKILKEYTEDVDYVEYDTIVDMPIRKNIGNGVYVIEKIVEDVIDNNLDNYITLKFRTDMVDSMYMNNLSYRLFDESIEKPLRVGDVLTSFEGNAKVQVVELRPNTNTIKVKVMYGEYLNLVESPTNDHSRISPLSKMKFFSPIDFDEDKYVKVPLEEDNFIFVTIAALNSRMNIQSAWGQGLMIETARLISEDNNRSFATYYNENVKNIGDILNELTVLAKHSLTKLPVHKYNSLTTTVPTLDESKIIVKHINSHLDDTETVTNIRNWHVDKARKKEELSVINKTIAEIYQQMSASGSDSNSNMAGLEADLKQAYADRALLVDQLKTITQNITLEATDSEFPLENAKYHIRGYFDYVEFLNNSGLSEYKDNVLAIKIQYRYKNLKNEYGTSHTIGDTFIYSDWNEVVSPIRGRFTRYDNDLRTYKIQIEQNVDNVNLPSFNQIDIPITRGETVDIRVCIVYDFGYPFAETVSPWSSEMNVSFPETLVEATPILDIIDENNNDIQQNYFTSLLDSQGVIEHVNDKTITDKNEVFFHSPSHIPSGFKTADLKIIPLDTKLKDMQSAIDKLNDEVIGLNQNLLQVSIQVNNSTTILEPNQITNVTVEPFISLKYQANKQLVAEQAQYDLSSMATLNYKPAYSLGAYNFSILEGTTPEGAAFQQGRVTTILDLNLTNISNRPIKIYPLFPGDKGTSINKIKRTKYDIEDYCHNEGNNMYGIHMLLKGNTKKLVLQKANQFITFRVRDLYTSDYYYGIPVYDYENDDKNLLSWDSNNTMMPTNVSLAGTQAYMYPLLNSEYELAVPNNTYNSYIEIPVGEHITIPIVLEYFADDTNDIQKTMSFDIKTSLYTDPLNYTFTVPIKHKEDPIDRTTLSKNANLSTKVRTITIKS